MQLLPISLITRRIVPAGSVLSLALITGFLAVGLTSCSPLGAGRGARPIAYTITDGAFRTSPDRSINVISPIYDVVANEIRLDFARNESRGFFLRLQPVGSTYSSLTITAEPLINDQTPNSAAAIDLFRVLNVDVAELPGWHVKAVAPQNRRKEVPDVLVPISAPVLGQPYSLDKGQELIFWVDVTVPQTCTPGRYSSAIKIRAGESVIAHIPLHVAVLPLTLPIDPNVALLAPVHLQKLLGHHLEWNNKPFAPDRVSKAGPLYEQSARLVHSTLLLLQRHGISPYLTGHYPIAKLDSREALTVKWEDYDNLIADFLDGQLYPNQPRTKYWAIPFDKYFPPPPPYDPLTSATYTRTLRQYLTLCQEHFEKHDWASRSFILLPPGEPAYNDSDFNTARRHAGIARLANIRLPLVSFLPPQDLRPYGWEQYPYLDLEGLVDIWCPSAQFFDPKVFTHPQYRNTRQWLRLDRPPYSGCLEFAAGDTFARVIPWQAARLKAEAVLLPEVNNWADDYSTQSPREQIKNHPHALILPGKWFGLDTPIPTLRLKMLRRGMQDLAYLTLCRESGLQRVHDDILQSLCHYAGADAYGAHFDDGKYDGWHRDPTWWNQARALMVEELLTPSAGEPGNHNDARKHSIEWLRFWEATQQVTLRSNGVRVRHQPDGGTSGRAGFEIDFSLTIENQTRSSVSAVVSLDELPMGWTTEMNYVSLDSIAPWTSRQVTLRASASAIPAGNDGNLSVPIVLEIDGRKRTIHQIRLSHMTIRRLNKPIHLDGELLDWPQGIGNVATNFAPINHAPRPSATPNNEEVMAWVCTDNRYLYFLFHCLTPSRHEDPNTRRNFLTYDDRIPVGEELIEILIDPSNKGSNSPGDLYHLAIKPSGALLTEKGISSTPQLAPTYAWPAKVEVVTKILSDRWVAEVRIPLESFGPALDHQRTWGLNYCRFNVADWTYSTWSGAVWNAYDPMSLGNMTFSN